jgi:hypothetical protein
MPHAYALCHACHAYVFVFENSLAKVSWIFDYELFGSKDKKNLNYCDKSYCFND